MSLFESFVVGLLAIFQQHLQLVAVCGDYACRQAALASSAITYNVWNDYKKGMPLPKLLSYWADIPVYEVLHHRVRETLLIRGSTINLKLRTAWVKIVTKYPYAAYQCNFDNTIQCSRVADLQWEIIWCESTFNHVRGCAFIIKHHLVTTEPFEMLWANILPWEHPMLRGHQFATLHAAD